VLAVTGKSHQVGLPMTGRLAVQHLVGPLVERHPMAHMQGWTAALAGAPAPLRLGPRQVVAPGEVVVPTDLGVDEAIDALMAEANRPVAPEPAGDLLGRPAGLQLAEHLLAQGR